MSKYTPHYCRDGNRVILKEVVREADRLGNLYDLTYVTYLDKKDKEHREVILVKHLGQPHDETPELCRRSDPDPSAAGRPLL